MKTNICPVCKERKKRIKDLKQTLKCSQECLNEYKKLNAEYIKKLEIGVYNPIQSELRQLSDANDLVDRIKEEIDEYEDSYK